MEIELKNWKLEEDFIFPKSFTGKAIMKIIDLGKENEVNLVRRKSINSVLSLLKLYSDWFETSTKIRLTPVNIQVKDNKIILQLKSN